MADNEGNNCSSLLATVHTVVLLLYTISITKLQLTVLRPTVFKYWVRDWVSVQNKVKTRHNVITTSAASVSDYNFNCSSD